MRNLLLIIVLCLPAPWLGAQSASGTGHDRVPVVVELFTSEGCSSCPPADALLMQLEHEQPVPGAEVIALGEHVDYWNRLGWQDRFSSALYSTRQSRYASRFDLDSVYTPQMVVDGRVQFVGNDSAGAAQAIADAARSSTRLADIAVSASGGALQVAVAHAPSRPTDVVLAITESGLSTQVQRGENRGRLLRHPAVVRELRKLGTTSGGRFAAEIRPALNPEWRRENLRAVVFLQDPATLAITGAAETAWH